jgi:hypothetical protein
MFFIFANATLKKHHGLKFSTTTKQMLFHREDFYENVIVKFLTEHL